MIKNIFFLKNLKNFDFSINQLILIIFFIQIFLFFFIYFPTENFRPLSINYDFNSVNITSNDGPSYLNFDFSNIEIILSQHRTFGMPLILKFYQFFDNDFIYWSKFNFLLFCLSNMFFFYALVKFDFSKIFSFFLVIGVLITRNIYVYFSWWTEIYSIFFVLCFLSFMFFAIKKNNLIFYLSFSFFFFFTYQIRPGHIFYVFVPIFFVLLFNLLNNNKLPLAKISFFSISPLVVFLIIRLFFTGSFGLAPMTGFGTSGNSLFYLTNKQIPLLNQENQFIAKKLLLRKKTLSYPCNLNYEDLKKVKAFKKKKKKGFKLCWNEYGLISWLEVIKINKNMEPFNLNDPRNIEPWKYKDDFTSGWWGTVGNFNDIDKILIDYSIDVYKLNSKKIFIELIKSPIYFFNNAFFSNKSTILFYLLVIIFYLSFFIKDSKNNLKKFKSSEFVFMITIFLLLFACLPIFYILSGGEIRNILFTTFLVIPTVFSYLIYLVSYNVTQNLNN